MAVNRVQQARMCTTARMCTPAGWDSNAGNGPWRERRRMHADGSAYCECAGFDICQVPKQFLDWQVKSSLLCAGGDAILEAWRFLQSFLFLTVFQLTYMIALPQNSRYSFETDIVEAPSRCIWLLCINLINHENSVRKNQSVKFTISRAPNRIMTMGWSHWLRKSSSPHNLFLSPQLLLVAHA